MRLTYRLLCLILVACATSCAEIQDSVCVDRLSDHFAAGQTFARTKPANLSEFRTALAQMRSLAETADTEGCKSQTVFAVNELKAGIADMQLATSDSQMLMHGLFSLFDAGDSSPLSQEAKAAQNRVKTAVDLLKQAGIRGLD